MNPDRFFWTHCLTVDSATYELDFVELGKRAAGILSLDKLTDWMQGRGVVVERAA